MVGADEKRACVPASGGWEAAASCWKAAALRCLGDRDRSPMVAFPALSVLCTGRLEPNSKAGDGSFSKTMEGLGVNLTNHGQLTAGADKRINTHERVCSSSIFISFAVMHWVKPQSHRGRTNA